MKLTPIAAALAMLALPAAAQIGNPGNLDPATPILQDGTPDPDHANSHDKLSAQLLAEGGMAEVAFARLAADRAGRDEVRDFAQTMIEDHEKANARLQSLAEAAGIPLPDGLNADHQAMLDKLEALSGDDFDRAYIKGQITDHQKTVQLLSGEVDSGQNAPFQAAAAALLPIVQDHLTRARTLHAEMSGPDATRPARRSRNRTGSE